MPLFFRIVQITALPVDAEDAIGRHREHIRELAEAGKLRSAGEFKDGDGFLEIFEAVDLMEAEEIARRSPLVSEGLGSWILREWREIPTT